MTTALIQLPPPPTEKGMAAYWGDLKGASLSLALSEAASAHSGLITLIVPDTASADALRREVRFFSATQDRPVMVFPDWETLPYDYFSPHQDIVSQRLTCLYQLPATKQGLLIVPVTTLLQRIAPQSFVSDRCLILAKGDSLNLTDMAKRLGEAGYNRVDTVYQHGEFAVRGCVVDLYPAGSELPVRIDLFDEDIEGLRFFDPETQMTAEHTERVEILPAREFPLDETAIAQFRQSWRSSFDGDPQQCPTYQDISNGIAAAGAEYYLPFFFDQCATLFDYLPSNTLVATLPGIEQAAEAFWSEVKERYEQRQYDLTHPILEPQHIFMPVEKLFENLKAFPRLKLDEAASSKKAGSFNVSTNTPPSFLVDHRKTSPLSELTNFLDQNQLKTLFCAESAGRREALLELLRGADIQPTLCDTWTDFTAMPPSTTAICVAPLERGLWLQEAELLVISEPQLFGQQVMQRRRRRKSDQSNEWIVKSLAELQIGTPVVHIDHGVGRYRGLETLSLNDGDEEFLTLEYAEEAKLYVPIASLHLISRYSGADEDHAPLHRLGSDKWQRAKRKAAEQIRDTAAELLEIHARREARRGFAFKWPQESYQAFSSAFSFEETPDQESAISATLQDMAAPQPMDRLVCGDVGFGKTEVAMRAVFATVHAGKQAAILVPTTLLAQQHGESFRDRFADWPVNVEVLSRFRSAKEQKEVMAQLKQGKVDLVIGTHKLLSADIGFSDLGLLIIDEEHRFGVRHKERIKALRAEVDILTLTATPIPRTLNMAMAGIRDISIIASPPAKRLSVRTFVQRSEDAIRREAINRELLRGGQVYLLHNEVESIERKAAEIAELAPQARVCVAHGQMPERELEQIMSDFYHKRFNVLICTTIIETGIDVPSANTIIIERADKFGLAQLHQLRGRVGRSHHQAYAYLLTPKPKQMTADAKKRLEVIANAQELGAGFTLASHDLEIRGAGELLGEQQSGQIHAIGFTLYAELLEQAVEAMRKGETLNLEDPVRHGTEVNLNLPALIPEIYLPDVHTRLVLYKRIANADSSQQLRELQVEMIDRFGLLPEPVKHLFKITELKLSAQLLGIRRLELNPKGGKIEFGPNTEVSPQQLVALIQKDPMKYKLQGTQLLIRSPMETKEQRFEAAEALLTQLSSSLALQERAS